MANDEYCNPMRSAHYYAIVRVAFKRAYTWFKECGMTTFQKDISDRNSAKALLELITKDPDPLIDYIYGLSGLRRIQINGKGTKKDPYVAIWRDDYYEGT